MKNLFLQCDCVKVNTIVFLVQRLLTLNPDTRMTDLAAVPVNVADIIKKERFKNSLFVLMAFTK